MHSTLNEWGADPCSRIGREAKLLELVYVRTRAIAASHDLFSYLHCGNVNDAFLGCLQQTEGMVAIADDAATSGGSNSIIRWG